MSLYTVKDCPLRKGGEIIPIGGTVELTAAETKGLEHLLTRVLPSQNKDNKKGEDK